jgi:DNA-binding transcriptional regulator YiaG
MTVSATTSDALSLNAQNPTQDVLSPIDSQELRVSTPLTPSSFASTDQEESVLSPGAAKMFEALSTDASISDMEIKEQRKRMKEARRLSVAIPPPLPSNTVLQTSLTRSTPRECRGDRHSSEKRPGSSRSSTHNARTSSRPETPPQRSHSLRSLSVKGRSTGSLRPSTPKEPLPSMENLPYNKLVRKQSGNSQPSSSSRQLSPTEPKGERHDKEKRLANKVKRRISMLATKPRLPEDEGYASSSTQGAPGRRAHSAKKSLSLWSSDVSALTRLSSVKSLDSASQYQDRYQRSFSDLSEPVHRMTDKERIEHLRRTRKLAQVFGHEPPAELLQTHHDNRDNQPTRRDSSSTLASLSSANLLLSKGPSAASTTSPRPSGSQSDDDDEPSIRPKPPAPFTDLASEDSRTNSRPPLQSAAFYERRKRVAKLSRFFGVAAHDITVPLAASSQQSPYLTPVDVKVIDKGHFWSSGDHWKEGNDLDELRHRLRDLRAS